MTLKLVIISMDKYYMSVQLHKHLSEDYEWYTACHCNDLIETIEKVMKISNNLKQLPAEYGTPYRKIKKTWLINSKDIEDYAKEVAEKSIFCVFDNNPGWIVDIVTDNLSEATLWWKKQNNSARVYQGQTGVLIHSK